MNNTKVTYIPNELASAVKGGFVTNTKEIRDKNLNVSQEEINKKVVQAGEDIFHLSQTAFSGSYNDLTNTPIIPTVPTNISSFENDLDYATKQYVENKLQETLREYPETLETVRRLSAALDNDSITRELFETLSTKANSSDVYSKTESDLRYIRDHQDISGKANINDVYSKDRTYSKEEVNLKIGNIGDLSVKQYITQYIDSLNLSPEVLEALLQLSNNNILDILANKANSEDVYTKEESDLRFQEKGEYATENYVDQKISEVGSSESIRQLIGYIQNIQQQVTQLQSNQQKHVILHQSEYDSLENYERDVIYIILEDITNWGFGDSLPITLA